MKTIMENYRGLGKKALNESPLAGVGMGLKIGAASAAGEKAAIRKEAVEAQLAMVRKDLIAIRDQIAPLRKDCAKWVEGQAEEQIPIDIESGDITLGGTDSAGAWGGGIIPDHVGAVITRIAGLKGLRYTEVGVGETQYAELVGSISQGPCELVARLEYLIGALVPRNWKGDTYIGPIFGYPKMDESEDLTNKGYPLPESKNKSSSSLILEQHRKNRAAHPVTNKEWWYNA